jgi:hypothetical protein
MTNSFSLDHVLFLGRSLNEYEQMFDLDISSWRGKKILDCPAGAASFVAEASREGFDVTGCDPLYEEEDVQTILSRWKSDVDMFIGRQGLVPGLFEESKMRDVEAFRASRRKSLDLFLNDYSDGRKEGRYAMATLPTLPWRDRAFDLVLSSNLLFFYSDTESGGALADSELDLTFHRSAIMELIRVCSKEVRVYPVMGPNADEHPYLRDILKDLKDLGIATELRPVTYRGLKGALDMLRIIL